MRYFIADLEAEGAVAQVGASRVQEQGDGSLRYRLAGSNEWRLAPAGQWSQRWDVAARSALSLVRQAIVHRPEEHERLEHLKSELLSASEALRRSEQQLGLFDPAKRD